jgi:hypothetical protein
MMTFATSNPHNMPPRRGLGAILPLVLGLAVGVVLMGALVFHYAASPSRLWSALLSRTSRFDLSQPTVVDRIQKMQRLETVVYTMDKVVSGERENPVLPNFLAGDRILLLVHGEVVAGIDFASLKPGDVSVKDKAVHLHLPDATIFSTRLDSDKTRVYSRQTGLLVPVDPNLETQARQQAEHQLQESALQDGILKTAQQNARTTLTGMLTGLGFEKVEFGE